MPYYLHTIQGLQNASFPWSLTMVSFGTVGEAQAQVAWDGAALSLWQNATLLPFISTHTTLIETSTSTASPTFRQTTKTTNTHNVPGTSTSQALSYSTCEIITWRTAFSTRWGRGRWYFPALATNALSLTGYSILAAAQTALVDGIQGFWTSLGTTLQPQILHRKGSIGGAVTPFSTSPITGADIPDSFAVQTRRADKRVPTRTAAVL